MRSKKNLGTPVFYLTALLFSFYPLAIWPFGYPAYTFKYPVFLFLTFSLALIWILKGKNKGFQKIHFSSLFCLLTLFAFLFLSFLFSASWKTAFFGEHMRYEGFLTLVLYFFLFACFSSNFSFESFQELKNFVLTGFFLASSIAVFEHFFFNPILYLMSSGQMKIASGRSFSTFANPTSFSTYLVLTFPLVLYFALQEARRKNFLSFPLLVFLTGFAALLFTYSRSSWLGFFFGFSIFIFLNYFFTSSFELATTGKIVFLLFLIFALVYFLPSRGFELSQRIAHLIEVEAGTSGGNRLLMWKGALQVVRTYPLLGTGPDTLKLSFPRSSDMPWGKSSKSPLLDKAHNEFLQLAFTQGLGYLFCYLSFLVYLFLKSFFYLKKRNSYKKKALVIALLSSLAGYLFNLQFLFSHYSVAPLFWVLSGILFGLTAEDNKKPLKLSFSSPLFVFLSLVVFFGYLFLVSFWIAQLYYYQAEKVLKTNPLKALTFYRQAVTFSPWEDLFWLKQGEAAAEATRFIKNNALLEGVEVSLKTSLRINPLNEVHYFRVASTYLKLAQSQARAQWANKALEFVEKGLNLNPYFGPGWLAKGNVYGTLAELKEKDAYYRLALESYIKAVSLGEKTATVYYNLGWCYQKLKRVDEARRAYEKSLQLDPNYSQALEKLEQLKNTSP